MAFSSSSSSSVSEINVTPLIDVLLVLLIIFMVIVPVMPRGLDSSIPQDHQRSSNNPPSPLVLAIMQGNGGGPARYQLNSRDVELAELRPTLQRVFAAREDRTLFVQGDRELTYGPVAAAIGEARAAGAGAVGFMPAQSH